MRKFARLPAFFVLLVAAGSAVAISAFHGTSSNATTTASADLDRRLLDLGNRVAAGKADGQTWLDYGNALRQAGKFRSAADAYKRALAADVTDIHAAQLGRGLSLGRDTDDAAYFNYLDDLVAIDAKAVLAILDSPESVSKKANPRFEKIHQSAELQAPD